MKTHRLTYLAVRSFIALITAVIFAVPFVPAFAQESEDAMDEFLNDSPTDAASTKQAEPTAEAEIVDLRGETKAPSKATVAVEAVAGPNPALDKIEALLIADAELKAFMKAGGLRSRKIK